MKLSCADRIVVVCGLLSLSFCFSAAVAAGELLSAVIAVNVAAAVITAAVAAANRKYDRCERLSLRRAFSFCQSSTSEI